MPNPLEVSGPPIAPQADAVPMQGGNSLTAQPGTPIPQQQEAPAPTRHQTIVAIRHLRAIEAQLDPLLKDPELGKSDLKSKIIDGVTKLVSDRIITPAQAVLELSNVPDKPLDQRKWATQQMQQTVQSQHLILEHYAQSANQDEGTDVPHPDDHLQQIGQVVAHYKGLKRG